MVFTTVETYFLELKKKSNIIGDLMAGSRNQQIFTVGGFQPCPQEPEGTCVIPGTQTPVPGERDQW